MAEMSDKEVVDWIVACRDEADEAKRDRMNRNKDNYDMFHLKHDFSHKKEGQSQDVLSKQSMAVESIKSFFQQALADLGDWWSAEAKDPGSEEGMPIREHEITTLTNYMLEQERYFSHVGNSVESALLASLCISKTYGVMKAKPRFVSKTEGKGKKLKRYVEKIEDKTWRLKHDLVRAENYYPDPSGKGLYEVEDMWPDYYEVLALAEGDDAIYDLDAVKKLAKGVADSDQEFDKAREAGQNTYSSGHRPKVKLTEIWGSFLDKSGKICYENHVATIANDTVLIRKPEPNPNWHQGSPYTASPLLEVAGSVWHKALCDAGTSHNRSLNELYNLLVDAGFKEINAISQHRKDWMDNPAQVADGIKPGMSIGTNALCPPGGKVLEPLEAVKIPNELFNVFNVMNQEFNSSMLTNDLRQGVMPFRAVKATEVVEASQTITSVFQGMAKNWESRQSTRELELAWMTTAQNWDKISEEEFISLFGRERGMTLSKMSPEDVFVNTVNGFKFRVFGVSLTLSKANDYKKLTTLLQTVFSMPTLTEAFVAKYSPIKLLDEVMTSLDIDKYKLEIPHAEQKTVGQSLPGESVPDINSQLPQASGMSDMMGEAPVPNGSFPTAAGM